MVVIAVGTAKERFYVHEELICNASSFLNNSFVGGFQESQEKKLSLPDVEPRIFRAFLDWLYSRATVLDDNTGNACLNCLGDCLGPVPFKERTSALRAPLTNEIASFEALIERRGVKSVMRQCTFSQIDMTCPNCAEQL